MDKNSIYMQSLSESLTNFGEVINKSFSYMYDSEFLSESLKVTADSLKEVASAFAESIDINLISDALHQLSEFSKTLPDTDFSFLTTDVVIKEDYVSISESAVDNLNDFLVKHSKETTTKFSKIMNILGFVGGVITIISFLLDISSFSIQIIDRKEETRTEQQTTEHQETMIDIHSQILEEIRNIYSEQKREADFEEKQYQLISEYIQNKESDSLPEEHQVVPVDIRPVP